MATPAQTDQLAEYARRCGSLPTTAKEAVAAATDDEKSLLFDLLERVQDVRRRKSAAKDRLPKRPKPNRSIGSVERHRVRMAAKSREANAAARELGELPQVVDPQRREDCRLDLRRFLLTYFAAEYPIAFSPTHERAIAYIQAAFLAGSLQALAMPRGSGKSTICRHAIIWAAVYRHRPIALLCAATAELAVALLDTIKILFEEVPRLRDDFPEIVYPLRELNQTAQRAGKQRYRGKATWQRYGRNHLTLAAIDPADVGALDAIDRRDKGLPPLPQSHILCKGILSASRGIQFVDPITRRTERPSAFLVDDFQTDATAASPAQIAKRIKLINGALLGLAGPGVSMAGVAAVTVIESGDAADQLLDRERSPEWRGIRSGVVDQLPDNYRLHADPSRVEEAKDTPNHWSEWNRLRIEAWQDFAAEMDAAIAAGLPAPTPDAYPKCAAYYAEHRDAMDAGCRAEWPESVTPPYTSAIEAAMGLLFRNAAAFWSERMNDPSGNLVAETTIATVETVVGKTNGRPRGVVSQTAPYLVGHVDVQKSCLVWTLVEGDQQHRAAVVDYGTYPDRGPGAGRWTRATHSPTIEDAHPTGNHNASVKLAIVALLDDLFGRTYRREGHEQPAAINLLLVDAGYLTREVCSAIRSSPHAGRVLPSRGREVKPDRKRISDWDPDTCEIYDETAIDAENNYGLREVKFDANYYKRRVHTSWLGVAPTPGSLTVFGDATADHELFAEHQTAERPKSISVNGQPGEQWSEVPGRENDHFDNVVAAMAALNVCGAQYPGAMTPVEIDQLTAPPSPPREVVYHYD